MGVLVPDLREPEIHWLHGKPLKYWPSNPYRLNRYQTKADGFRCRTRISDWPATDEQKMISVHARSITSLGVGTHRARGGKSPSSTCNEILRYDHNAGRCYKTVASASVPKWQTFDLSVTALLSALAEMSDGLIARQTHRDDVGVDSGL